LAQGRIKARLKATTPLPQTRQFWAAWGTGLPFRFLDHIGQALAVEPIAVPGRARSAARVTLVQAIAKATAALG
jgi:hypothetical protein